MKRIISEKFDITFEYFQRRFVNIENVKLNLKKICGNFEIISYRLPILDIFWKQFLKNFEKKYFQENLKKLLTIFKDIL